MRLSAMVPAEMSTVAAFSSASMQSSARAASRMISMSAAQSIEKRAPFLARRLGRHRNKSRGGPAMARQDHIVSRLGATDKIGKTAFRIGDAFHAANDGGRSE